MSRRAVGWTVQFLSQWCMQAAVILFSSGLIPDATQDISLLASQLDDDPAKELTDEESLALHEEGPQCLSHCQYVACSNMNGNIDQECGACMGSEACRPGQPGFSCTYGPGFDFVGWQKCLPQGSDLRDLAADVQPPVAVRCTWLAN